MSRRRRSVVIAIVVLVGLIGALLIAKEAKHWIKVAYATTAPRSTDYPSAAQPDQVCLTWSGDPTTTQTVQWRAAPSVTQGVVEYRKSAESEEHRLSATAQSTTIDDPLVSNDPSNRRFTAVLTGLEPATTYTYRVGDPAGNLWSDWHEFRTAPSEPGAFSFAYLGDVQVGWSAWGGLLRQVVETQPQTAFFIIAGDLANRGNDRDDWDSFFGRTEGVFDSRPLLPVIGNHDCAKLAKPEMYLQFFALPENGPPALTPERAYRLDYGNALFVVLDSNLSPVEQRSWLEEQLADTSNTWRFVVYHHPAYSSAPHRNNKLVREQWGDLFDRYHVDMVLQGHDHAYLRTPPMNNRHKVDSPAEGTIYVVAVSGSKYYPQEDRDYTAVGLEDTSTYQIIDIQTEPTDTLTYRAYNQMGRVIDEVVIEKNDTTSTSTAGP
ncbi:MAG TPA: metallophosphoesterase family protein [Candidatus Hydrogenedentes bacterium]|nr:metallophosphoesterase family protein [Candidatus Hydrogenedentota bacterium]HPG66981.1 metallophosphoesterase family protein [Candidatus Hydrogenedentota bacterium]